MSKASIRALSFPFLIFASNLLQRQQAFQHPKRRASQQGKQQSMVASVCPSCLQSQQLKQHLRHRSLLPLQSNRRQACRRQCMRAVPSAQVLPRKTPEWKPPGDIPTEPGRVPPDYSPPGEKPGMPSSPPEFTPPDQAPASPTVPESGMP